MWVVSVVEHCNVRSNDVAIHCVAMQWWSRLSKSTQTKDERGGFNTVFSLPVDPIHDQDYGGGATDVILVVVV